jgi:hypothetical protein
MPDFHPTGPDSPPPTVPTSPVSNDAAAAVPAEGHERPRGTLFLMILFLVLIVGLWTYAYILLLERS